MTEYVQNVSTYALHIPEPEDCIRFFPLLAKPTGENPINFAMHWNFFSIRRHKRYIPMYINEIYRSYLLDSR